MKQLHTTTTETTTNIYTGDFEDFWHLYPKRQGGDPKKAAFRRWTRLVKNGVPVGEIIEGVKRYAALCSEQGTTGTKFVMQARTFLGPDERWKDSYEVEGSAGGDINLQELSW